MDVLQSKNHIYLEAIKNIEQLYEKADADGWNEYSEKVRNFNDAVDAMPNRVWLE